MPDLIEKIRTSVIGERIQIDTAFGVKPLIYADYTASGRSLNLIENYIATQVLPYYANTHTETSYTGKYTSHLREQARQKIKQAINAGDSEKVIFTGAGATAAIDKLISILGIRLPIELKTNYKFIDKLSVDARPVVFIGPYEHHSNELPWRETIADVVRIGLDSNGAIDYLELKKQLSSFQGRPLIIGSFSAASNVTGVKSDIDGITSLLHEYGALAFWDYAAAAPYMAINFHGDSDCSSVSPDAVFISPHKFIGGPGTPGVLVVNRALLSNTVPAVVGGGTVSYVAPWAHTYTTDLERKEEGGTPGIVESVRAGLVFELQQKVGINVIEELEQQYINRAMRKWGENGNIRILGSQTADRLSIFSFQIEHLGRPLHYGFVVALLNDLFGIQSRGGCSCAGSYGHDLLGLQREYSEALEEEISAGSTVLKPGWVRLNFNYFIGEEAFVYILNAVNLIANIGWRLLPYYKFNEELGVWLYQGRVSEKENIPSLFDVQDHLEPVMDTQAYSQLLLIAEKDILEKRHASQRFSLELSSQAEYLCWFTLPQTVEFD